MYPYPGRGPSQPPGPPSQSYGRGPSASRSPEQMRASVGRSVPLSPGGANNEDVWHRRQGPPEMREIHYQHPHQQSAGGRFVGGGGPAYLDRDEHDGPLRGPPPPHWLEDRGYGMGAQSRQGPPPAQPPPPSQQQHHHIDERAGARGQSGGPYAPSPSMHAAHPYSHPASPSHRPRTPPRMPRSNVGGGGAGGAGGQGSRGGAPPSWDPVAQMPMSAPPSLVPRLRTGGAAANNPGGGSGHPLHQQQTSPILPGLSSRAGSEGRSGHVRVPSWGPPSTRDTLPPPASPPRGAGSGPNKASPSAYRGASMDPYASSGGNLGGSGEMGTAARLPAQMDKSRKRPASESPPSHMAAPPSAQQASPTQRSDIMSMSSILGPSGARAATVEASGPPPPSSSVSGANGSAEKRRRLENAGGAGGASPSKGDGAGKPPSTTSIAISEAAAANLARRKWSGPIAEEAAQQAAAWRAQEQRWGSGSSRSPKVGMLPLAGNGGPGNGSGGAQERNTSPFGAMPNLPNSGRGASPLLEGHRRQRSDGLQSFQAGGGQPLDTRSPLARNAPLRGHSPPPALSAQNVQQHANARSMPKQQQQPHQPSIPSHPPAPPQQQQQQQQQPPPGYYRGHSPPPPSHHPGPPIPHGPGPGHGGAHYGGQPPPPAQVYNHPGYHAYDIQGNPVEIDVDEVRGGAFAGHGGQPHPPPPAHMAPGTAGGGMMPMYDELPRGRVGAAQGHQHGPSNTRRDGSVASSVSTSHGKQGGKQGSKMGGQQQEQQQQQQQLSRSQHQQAMRERVEGGGRPIRRSTTPVMPGPAKGLLPLRLEHALSKEANAVTARPLVASKDFNSGPKVDSEAVWTALKEIADSPHGALVTAREDDAIAESEKKGVAVQSGDENANGREYGRAIGRHLGSFLYEPRKSPLLPGDLLRRNVGATVEVRVSGHLLGVGPTKATQENQSGIHHGRWTLGAKALSSANEAPPLNGHASASSAGEVNAEEDFDAQSFWNNESMSQRKAWGTDVYTDDSDVLMMCLHTGWLQGPLTDDVPSWVPPGRAVNAWRKMTDDLAGGGALKKGQASSTAEAALLGKRRLERLEETMDVSVTLRVAPKLIAYKGSQRGGVKTRSWGNTHDGVSLVLERVCLKPSGYASGERGLRSMKQRIDQLARLKMLASIAGDAGPLPEMLTSTHAAAQQDDHVAAVQQHMLAGGLLDILAAAQLTADKESAGAGQEAAGKKGERSTAKRFWQFDPHVDVIKA